MDQKDEKQDPVVDPPRRKHGPPKGGGGPHNLGDPDDKFLRIGEKDFLIGKIRRDLAYDICEPIGKKFVNCYKEFGWARVNLGRYCQDEKKVMEDCIKSKFHSDDVMKKATEQYLQERRTYRMTGIRKKDRDKMVAKIREEMAVADAGGSQGNAAAS